MPRVKSGMHPVDVYVGQKLRTQRLLSGMSQTELGESVGLTFQQIQKYERGTNRVSASRLYDFCKVFGVPLDFFFKGFETAGKKMSYAARGMADNGQENFEGPDADDGAEDLMTRSETVKLVRAYYNIKDKKMRRQLLEMARAMSG